MKVGIISMQRVVNYGSFLQAYALKKMIESLGHEVQFIDYTVEKPIMHGKANLAKYYIRKGEKKAFGLAKKIPFLTQAMPQWMQHSAKVQNSYEHEYWKELGLSTKRNYRTPVDTLVIGSDEVFNCLQTNIDVGYSKELFGYGANAKKIITYAASFGNTTLEGLKEAGIAEEVRQMLSKISALSVRDDNSKHIVQELTDGKVYENLDPVLMYRFDRSRLKPVDIDNYIIVYAYKNRLHDEEIAAISQYAKKNNKKIVCIGGYHSFCDIEVCDSPLNIFSYFQKADCVFTDTFHGTIFSVINHCKFGLFVRQGHGKTYGNAEKLNDLVRKLGLENRVIDSLDRIDEIMSQEIDYDRIDALLEREREKTMAYLAENI